MKKLLTLLLLLACVAVKAQLTVDPTFNSSDHGGGKQSGVFGGESSVDLSLILPNGQILVGGFYGIMHNKTNQCLSLLNADGTIDPSFNAPGINDDLGDGVTAMALQPDGKILLGGYISIYHGKTVHHLVRINANGDLDTGFYLGSGISTYEQVPRSIVIQPDGKILVGGQFSSYDGNTVSGLIRLDSNGTIDHSFNFVSDSTTLINKIVLKSDGKIMIGGAFKIHSDNSYKNLARINADGSVDAAFKTDASIKLNYVYAFDERNDSKIVFCCDSSVYSINSDGSIDQSFTKGTFTSIFNDGYENKLNDLKIQADGKILLAGDILSYNNSSQQELLRLNSNGTIDNSFSIGTGFGRGEYDAQEVAEILNCVSIFNDGRIFLTGGFLFYRGVWQGTMAELNSDGSINSTFNASNGNGADANVNKMAVQPDNKILIAGYFDTYNGANRNKLARLNADGTLDNSFNAGTGPDSCNFLNTIVLQSDGKILAGGNFAKFNNVSKSYIVRLNTDGSLDNSFSLNAVTRKYGDVTDGVKAIAVQKDGKIIIGFNGIVNYITGSSDSIVVIRLNADGSLDNSFKKIIFSSDYYPTIHSIVIQADGKIVVAGDFELSNSNLNNLIRLNTDGSLDATFNPSGDGPNSTVYSASIQSDGKIIISGDFNSYNNTNANLLARINTNGSLDATYTPLIPDIVTDPHEIFYPVSFVDSNNKVTLSYLYYSDTIYGRVLRYNTNGTTDNTFGTENKTDFLVSDMALQNNKLLLGGFIQSFNGVKRNYIIRITTPEALPVKLVSFTAQKQNNSTLLQWQTTNEVNNNYFSIERSPDSKIFTSIGHKPATNSVLRSNYSFVDEAPINGINYYRLKQVDKDGKFTYSNIISVDFSSNAGTFGVYPNPANNTINITFPSINKTSDIILYDASGKEVVHEQLALNINSKQINVSKMPAGVYNVVLVQDGKQQTIKVVKR